MQHAVWVAPAQLPAERVRVVRGGCVEDKERGRTAHPKGRVDLTGGIEYLIVVGAATDTGAYELSVRQIDDVDDEEGEEQEFEDE